MQTSARLAEILRRAGTEKHYGKGEDILHQGDPPTHVVLLRHGSVKVTITLPDGRVYLPAIRRQTETLGTLGVLTRRPRTATVTALNPCNTVLLGASLFRELLAAHRLTDEVMEKSLSRLLEAEDCRVEQATLPAGMLLTRTLLRLSFAGPSGRYTLHLSQDELCEAVGRTRSVVSAELRRLRECGLVSTAHRRVTINDAARLREHAGEFNRLRV